MVLTMTEDSVQPSAGRPNSTQSVWRQRSPLHRIRLEKPEGRRLQLRIGEAFRRQVERE
jgi:hypothetical protein